MVVVTRGEKGACVRPGGCAPDLASVRSAEAGAAAQLFGATSIHLTYADGGGDAPPQWHSGSADAPDIVTALAGYIDAFRPEVVLTFDPRHGTTCHPDHREAGQLALDASRRSAAAPRVDFLETLVTLSTDPAAISFSPAFSEARRLDATRILASTGRQAWDFLTEDLKRHASSSMTRS
jgi:LmbE family N-acetylglucosaminyl deacetylase